MTVTRGRLGIMTAVLVALATVITAALTTSAAPQLAGAASHREAPLISLDPAADISDFFMFRSYEPGHEQNVVLIMNVNPGEEPSSGPNYYGFDPRVTYSFEIDNDRDGKADDVRFDFRFRTQITGLVEQLDLPLAYVGGAGGLPAVTDVESVGNGVRQSYEVRMSTGGDDDGEKIHAGWLPVLPNNVGPRTTPNYEANFLSEGIKNLGGGIRVFAGPRDDPFYIDLGAVFDTLNLRPIFGTAPGHGIDMLAGHNVHTIALEIPMAMISNASNAIGAYAFTSRGGADVRGKKGSDLVQVQRLANPLVNEVIIPTERKDEWNAKAPEQEADFLSYYLKPRFALAEQLILGINTGCLLNLANCAPSPPAAAGLDLAAFNRNDLQAILLRYNGLVYGAGAAGVDSDLLRLNLTTPPTPLASQSSVPGALGGDAAAWPNGRRPNDDVTDIAVKAVGGPNYVPLATVDGVNANDVPTTAAFPFLAAPHDGVTRVHANP